MQTFLAILFMIVTVPVGLWVWGLIDENIKQMHGISDELNELRRYERKHKR